MPNRKSSSRPGGGGLVLIGLVVAAIFAYRAGLMPQPVAQVIDPIAKQLEPIGKQLEPIGKQLEPIAKQLEPLVKSLPALGQTPAPAAQPPTGAPVSNVAGNAPGALPEMAQKPQPQEITFKGCPPEGDGSDPELNRLKNRVDEGAFVPVNFESVLNLPWPQATERKDRAKWSANDKATVYRYEGVPISVEGYLFDAKQEGPESPNCHGAEAEFLDFHVWLTNTAGEDRIRSIVVEATPRVRANHPTWTTQTLDAIAKNKQRVRISGWLMLDPEHPDQVEKTRGTIWEIHPIMKIEVQRGSAWTPL